MIQVTPSLYSVANGRLGSAIWNEPSPTKQTAGLPGRAIAAAGSADEAKPMP